MVEDAIAAASVKLDQAAQAGDAERLEALQEARAALEEELDRDLDQTIAPRH